MSVPGINVTTPTVPDVGIGSFLNPPDFNFNLDFDLGPEIEKIVIVVVLCVGLLFLFFGTRLFKLTLFLFSFLGAGFLAYLFTYSLTQDAKASLITAGVVALLMSCLIMKAFKLAIFAIGAAVGFVLWLVFKALFPTLLTEELTYVVLAGLVIVFGLVALKMEKFWLLLATPALGAFMFLAALDHFVPEDLNVFQMVQNPGQGCKTEMCYMLYGSFFLLTALGIFVQYRFTSHWASRRRKNEAHERKGEKKAEKKYRKARARRKGKSNKHRRRRRRSSSSEDSDDSSSESDTY